MENDQQELIVKNGLIPVFVIVMIMALAVVGSELKGAYNRAALDFMSSKERTPEEMREEVIKWLCACAESINATCPRTLDDQTRVDKVFEIDRNTCGLQGKMPM